MADSHGFDPREVARKRQIRSAEVIATRRSRRGKTKTCPRPSEYYTRHSYRVAIRRDCLRAGVKRWHPNQLRDARATEIRERYGLEVAQVVLGHAQISTTQIYAESDLSEAVDFMRAIG
jgi:integrase